MYRNIKAIVGVLFLVPLSSCSQERSEYCQKLHNVAKKPDIQNVLNIWVEKEFEADIRKEQVQFGGLIVPGLYTYKSNFEWDIINFDKEKSQVRLIGPHPKDIENGVVKNIKSVFFAERSRYGIVVKLTDQENFGLDSDEKYIIPVSNSIGVVCISPDR